MGTTGPDGTIEKPEDVASAPDIVEPLTTATPKTGPDVSAVQALLDIFAKYPRFSCMTVNVRGGRIAEVSGKGANISPGYTVAESNTTPARVKIEGGKLVIEVSFAYTRYGKVTVTDISGTVTYDSDKDESFKRNMGKITITLQLPESGTATIITGHDAPLPPLPEMQAPTFPAK